MAEATFAPIFADKPLIRYRKDTLEAGLKAHPEYDTAENRLALYILENVIGNQNSPPRAGWTRTTSCSPTTMKACTAGRNSAITRAT